MIFAQATGSTLEIDYTPNHASNRTSQNDSSTFVIVDANAVSTPQNKPAPQVDPENAEYIRPASSTTPSKDIGHANYITVTPTHVQRSQQLPNTAMLPRPYWNGVQQATHQPVLVAVPINGNSQVPTQPFSGNTNSNLSSGVVPAVAVIPNSQRSTIQLASGNASGDSSSVVNAIPSLDTSGMTSGVLLANDDVLYGSIPSGTPILLAQSQSVSGVAPGSTPVYAPYGSLSPATTAGTTPTTLDPYAAPNSGTFLSPGYQSPTTTNSTGQGIDIGERYDEMMRLLSSVTAEYCWMPGSGSAPLAVNDFKAQARFSIPCQHLGNSMVHIAPGFRMTFWDLDSHNHFDMSDATFSGFIDAGIEPELNGTKFHFDIWGRVGVYSDFHKVSSESIYVSGRANAYYQYNPTTEWVLGVIYLNRERVKLLPSVGIIWEPNPDVRWRLVFPDPKLSRRLGTSNNTEWWGYVRGDYGGGRWAIEQNGSVNSFDYNDIRVALGLEFLNRPKQCLSGYVEVGGAFNRELYSEGGAFYQPSSCVFLGGGLTY